MKPSSRVLVFLVVIEAGLAGLWWYLLERLRTGELRPAGNMADTVATLSSTMGGLMGGIAGLVLVLSFVLRLRGR